VNSVNDAAENFAIFFMFLDNRVFGHTQFKITDTSIFRNNNRKALIITFKTKDTSQLKTNNIAWVTYCQDVSVSFQYCPWIAETGSCYGPGGSCDKCEKCLNSFSEWYYTYCWGQWEDIGGGGGAFTPGSGDPYYGGGNGGGGLPPNPCGGTGGGTPTDLVASVGKSNGMATQGAPCGGGNTGWTPYTPPNNSPYNPYVADNVILDTSITNNFPCLKALLDTLSDYGNFNQNAQIALSQIFGVNKYIHTTIKLDKTLIGSTTSAYTKKQEHLLRMRQILQNSISKQQFM